MYYLDTVDAKDAWETLARTAQTELAKLTKNN